VAGSCKKDGGNSTTNTAPTNLVITATVSADGSGNVAFVATATNAVTYDFEFGNGVAKTVPTGIINYQYAIAGTTTYTVVVTAKSSSGLSVQKSVSVTVTVNPALPGLFWSEEFTTGGALDPANWINRPTN